MNNEEFINKTQELGLNLNEFQLQQLEEYACFLVEYNEITNLTSITDKKSIYLKHFYDSLTIVKAHDFKDIKNLADIGTGAGFPGVVLKIAFPKIFVTLVESNNKKVTFLKKLQEKLSLKDIEIVYDRAENYAHQNLEKFDIVTSRAVSSMSIISELCLPMVRVGGYFLALKGNVLEELNDATKTIEKLNGRVDRIESFKLDIEGSTRNIVKIEKIFPTPKGYPRSYDKIKKTLKSKEK